MAESTGISWTDATFNPWWGCQKVSPACDHCYAERDAKRFAAGKVLWGVDSERRTFGDAHWNAPLKWAKAMPAKLGRRPRVFCASMADWLDLDGPLPDFVRLLDTIRQTPELDWLLLSKRIGNWRKRLAAALDSLATVSTPYATLIDWLQDWLDGDAPSNVWLGATVIDQPEADRDIPKLLAVPARARFLSVEPMLGPLAIWRYLPLHCERHPPPLDADGKCEVCEGRGIWAIGDEPLAEHEKAPIRKGLDWVICGGESGPEARPMHPDWARRLRDQCQAAGVPFHFKQWGEWVGMDQSPDQSGDTFYSEDLSEYRHRSTAVGTDGATSHDAQLVPAPERVFKVGKKAAGRLLDGIEHNGFPEVRHAA